MYQTNVSNDEVNSVIVIDNGSSGVKAGFAGDDEPKMKISSDKNDLPKRPVIWICTGGGRNNNQIEKYPIDNGIITNWDDMEFIWHYIFYNKLCVLPEEYPVLMTEAPLNTAICREKMTQIMFETFQTPAFFTANTGTLGLYASGRTTGIVIDFGEGLTSIVPCYEGYSLPHATLKFDINGADLTKYLADLLMKRGYSFGTEDEMKIVREIKEKFCYVALDYDMEFRNPIAEESYELPNGEFIKIGNERFMCSEILFDRNRKEGNVFVFLDFCFVSYF